jgi:hypothetical protein
MDTAKAKNAVAAKNENIMWLETQGKKNLTGKKILTTNFQILASQIFINVNLFKFFIFIYKKINSNEKYYFNLNLSKTLTVNLRNIYMIEQVIIVNYPCPSVEAL